MGGVCVENDCLSDGWKNVQSEMIKAVSLKALNGFMAGRAPSLHGLFQGKQSHESVCITKPGTLSEEPGGQVKTEGHDACYILPIYVALSSKKAIYSNDKTRF